MSVHFSEFFVVFPSSSSPLVLSENQRNKIREEGVEEGEEGGTSRGIERREERRERERERIQQLMPTPASTATITDKLMII